MMSITATDCFTVFAPYLANVVCCPQLEATLVILIGQSSKKTKTLSLNSTHAKHCLSDFDQILTSQGADNTLQQICSVGPSNLTEASCPVKDVDGFEKMVNTSKILASCGKIDLVNECCRETCQNAISEAAKDLASVSNEFDAMGIRRMSDISTRVINDCKSIVLRWLASKLEPLRDKEALRGLANCNVNKGNTFASIFQGFFPILPLLSSCIQFTHFIVSFTIFFVEMSYGIYIHLFHNKIQHLIVRLNLKHQLLFPHESTIMNLTNSLLIKFRGNSITTSFLLHSNFSTNRSMLHKITNLNHALNLFDEMSQRRPLPSVVLFNQLLTAVTKIKHFSTSLHLFNQMCSLGVPVNEFSMSIAIKCCCQLNRTNDGFAVLGSCFRRAIPPNVYIYSALLDGLVLEDKILEAEMLFKKLVKQKLCEPNVVMYSTMIKGLCKFGNNVTAVALLRLMEQKNCKPSIVTYSTIIDSLCKDKMMDDALKLLKEMVSDKGILPNVITYNSLICGLCKLGRWNEASKLLKEMEDENISPDVQTFTALVDAFCKEGKVEEAEAVINIMIERGEVPNVVTYSSLLNGYCKNRNIEEAMQMFREMAGKGLNPNVVTYNTMLQGLFKVGRCVAARKLFDEMHAQGQIPDQNTYRIVLEGLCNSRQVEEALSLFQLMGDSKLNSDIVVYTILIDGAGKCGKFHIARNLFHGLSVKGLKPDVRTYNVMIGGFCREGLLGEAKLLFLKMEESGCLPNNVTYRVFVQGCLKNKHYDDVEMLLQEMDGRGYSLDASTLSWLIHHIAAGLLDRSMLKLLGKLVPKELLNNPSLCDWE
ncbi:putative tetratricopeptide-like helical domain superfamily [Helianthus annuus]|uniref:Tetratricopeptide-like helical domain superfamily n=2 Tax=Helianthus annuus TaxID=4232 RepID=A0A9K3NXQ1_HELAN|nr:putative tetratricopeptide-like helical domain superfamily [Helianthus annuus]